ncbi:MAG: ABC transporter permease subunit [Treponema sp.]|jgi:arabinogalactan oligomer/maltooligosaccharide transport system permease protein|nr:ABC transporter permease subunit [Treponema sp.]
MKASKYTFRRFFAGILIHIELLVVLLVVLYPLVWIIGSSFNPVNSINRGSMFPQNPTLDNYRRLFTRFQFARWYGHTLYVAVLTSICTMVIHSFTAFVFARLKFKGRKTGLLTVMILQMFPGFMGIIAIYILAMNFGLLNNLNMLVLVYVAGGIPGNIWLIRGFMLNIPKSLDEAALIDGASKVQLFFKIILPLSVPIVSFIGITSFMAPWMDYMLPSYLISKADSQTIAPALYNMVAGSYTQIDFTAFAAGCVLVAVPITIVFMVFQKFLLEGIVAGANKGE